MFLPDVSLGNQVAEWSSLLDVVARAFDLTFFRPLRLQLKS